MKMHNKAEVWLLAFLSSALGGGEGLASRYGRFSCITLWRENWWDPEMVWTLWSRKNLLTRSGMEERDPGLTACGLDIITFKTELLLVLRDFGYCSLFYRSRCLSVAVKGLKFPPWKPRRLCPATQQPLAQKFRSHSRAFNPLLLPTGNFQRTNCNDGVLFRSLCSNFILTQQPPVSFHVIRH
jgi:hypothetical protein